MLSIFLAYILEISAGKPKQMPQLEGILNSLVSKTESYFRRRFRNTKITSTLLVVFISVIVFAAVKFIIWDLGLLGKLVKILTEAFFIYFALSIKNIENKPEVFSSAIINDDSEQLIKNRIEFISENTAKDIFGVLLYAFLGGAPLVYAYKALNLFDEQYWFVSRVQAVFDYIPSRICIFLIPFASYVCKFDYKASFKTAFTDGRTNNEIPQAAFAGALSIQLGGLVYHNGLAVHKPYVGNQENEINNGHVQKSIRLAQTLAIITVSVMILVNYLWNIL